MTQNINQKSKLLLICTLLLVLVNSIAGANPPKRIVKLGFIPLTDCAPLVIAKEMGFFAKYGVDVQLSKEASWAVVRDKILNGELDGAHCLFSMPFSVVLFTKLPNACTETSFLSGVSDCEKAGTAMEAMPANHVTTNFFPDM